MMKKNKKAKYNVCHTFVLFVTTFSILVSNFFFALDLFGYNVTTIYSYLQ